MGVPKKKRSYTRRANRRCNHALKKVQTNQCTTCGEPTLPHRMCPNCHSYKGKRILELEA